MNKMKVAVLFGGVSSEHDVSVVSATSVLNNLDKEKYDVIMIGITKDGRWLEYTSDIADIASMKWENEPARTAVISPDHSHHGLLLMDGNSVEVCPIDVCFPVLHGKNGEDGTIQGLFELANIPYVGCDLLSSANCMDKVFTHIILENAGIPMAKWDFVTMRDMEQFEAVAERMEAKLGYPMFVKPANAGSSVGVSKAKNREQLKEACYVALKEDSKAIVEEFIDGREVENGVLGNDDPVASTVCGEITPLVEFYTYEAKYQDASTKLELPAPISDELNEEIRRTAEKAYRAIGCKGLSRVDFFVKRDGSGIVLNEINTLPGFTSISMYPKLRGASGEPYAVLLDKLIALALERK
ncbi:MAG: D-alanine--D-alanine ligase [Oscillospiraceae bacterium]|nr:D-alanine--D-alanine ligase [Oscillospiraceae bacterium]